MGNRHTGKKKKKKKKKMNTAGPKVDVDGNSHNDERLAPEVECRDVMAQSEDGYRKRM